MGMQIRGLYAGLTTCCRCYHHPLLLLLLLEGGIILVTGGALLRERGESVGNVRFDDVAVRVAKARDERHDRGDARRR